MSYIQDGGHGGRDPGAVKNGIIEKKYTLEASLYVNKRLNELGITSDVTRNDDSSLEENERVNRVKKYKNCISHHFNAGGGAGAEFIHSIHADGKFEHMLVDEFKQAGFPIRPRPVYFRRGKNGDFYYMHRRTGLCRTTIVEYDFVDGPHAEKIKDKSYREGMYECVVRAICRREEIPYRKLEPKPLPKKEAPKKGLFKVQIGAFETEEFAEKLAAKAKAKGFPVYIVKE
jgi:N-acetylmuramoyl-L-alanine amidase